MKRLNLIIPVLLAIFGTDCKKEEPELKAQVSVEVVDNQTGAPLEGVRYSMKVGNISKEGKTGADGIVRADTRDIGFYFLLNLEKNGYLPNNFIRTKINLGDSVHYVARLFAFDSVIKLEAENNKPTIEPLWFNLKNGAATVYAGEHYDQFIYGVPLTLYPYEKRTYYVGVVSDDAVSIFWSWDEVEHIHAIPFKDVVIPVRGDTLVYKVTN